MTNWPIRFFYLVIFFYSLFYSFYAQAQLQQTGYYQAKLPQNTNFQEPLLHYLREQGVIITYLYDVNLRAYALDTNLAERWVMQTSLPLYPRFTNYYYDWQGNFHVIIQEDSSSKKAGWLKINTKSGQYKYVGFELAFAMRVRNFQALDDHLFLKGVNNQSLFQPIIQHLAVGEFTCNIIPISQKNMNYSLENIQPDTISNAVYFITKQKLVCETQVRTFSNLFGLRDFDEIPNIGNTNYEDLVIYPINADDKLILGIYAPRCNLYIQKGVFSLHWYTKEKEKSQINFQTFDQANQQKAKPFKGFVHRTAMHQSDLYPFSQSFLSAVELFDQRFEIFNTPDEYLLTPYARYTSLNFLCTIPKYVVINAYNQKDGKPEWQNVLKVKYLPIIQDTMKRKHVHFGHIGNDSIIVAYFSRNGAYSSLIYRDKVLMDNILQKPTDLFPNFNNQEMFLSFKHLNKQHFVYLGYYGTTFTIRRLTFSASTTSNEKKPKYNK